MKGESVNDYGDDSGLRVKSVRIVHSRGRGIAAIVNRSGNSKESEMQEAKE